MMSPGEFLLVVISILAVAFFLDALKAKEIAIKTAVELCNQSGMQFLDGTAVLEKLRARKSRGSGFRLYRRYRFDYSQDRQDRRQGEVVLLGQQVTHASLWPTLNS